MQISTLKIIHAFLDYIPTIKSAITVHRTIWKEAINNRMIPSDSAQKKKTTINQFLQNCDEFPIFFFFRSILWRWESFPAFNKLPDFCRDSWSHNTYLYNISPWCWQKCLAKNTSMFVLCMTRVLKNSVDAQCYGWFNSWVLTFREKKNTNLKYKTNGKW